MWVIELCSYYLKGEKLKDTNKIPMDITRKIVGINRKIMGTRMISIISSLLHSFWYSTILFRDSKKRNDLSLLSHCGNINKV